MNIYGRLYSAYCRILKNLFPSYWKKKCEADEIVKRKNPRKWFEYCYRKSFGRKFDWENPKTLIEKQRWIMFNTDISKWTILADKYAVRSYIEEKGYGDMLIPLYGKWDSAEDIDFSNLPNDGFVLKTNHGSHDYMIIEDKSNVDLDSIKEFYREHLQTEFGIDSSEIHYWKIPHCVIAEKLMKQDGNLSSSLIDYKFYVFHGKPVVCAVFFNRSYSDNTSSFQLYDMDWVLKDVTKGHVPIDIPRPKTYDKMLQFCNDMCSEFPFVRMDFYEIGGKLYFGEFTFTPCALTAASQVFNPLRMKEWGKLMDLSIYGKSKESFSC